MYKITELNISIKTMRGYIKRQNGDLMTGWSIDKEGRALKLE